MRRLTPTILAAVAWGLLAAALPAAAQAPADAWLERLRGERLAAAERALTHAAVLPAPAAALLVAEETQSDAPVSHLAAWQARLTPEARRWLERILEAEGVPAEFVAVGWVESRFNPQAVSPKGARGVWQLMPETARRYGLTVSHERDDRTDLGRSTRAAARHLADLYEQFGDWSLALAAYNAGAERVEAALARAPGRDFWQARGWLPRETQDYVLAVLGAIGRVPPPLRERGGAAGLPAAERLGGAAQALD